MTKGGVALSGRGRVTKSAAAGRKGFGVAQDSQESAVRSSMIKGNPLENRAVPRCRGSWGIASRALWGGGGGSCSCVPWASKGTVPTFSTRLS